MHYSFNELKQKVANIIPEEEWSKSSQTFTYKEIKDMFVLNLGIPYATNGSIIIDKLKQLRIPYIFGTKLCKECDVDFLPLKLTFNINNLDDLDYFYVTPDNVFINKIPLSILLECKKHGLTIL